LNRIIALLFPLSVGVAVFDWLEVSTHPPIRLYHLLQVPILFLMVITILVYRGSRSGCSIPTLHVLLSFLGFALLSAFISSAEGIAFLRCGQVAQRIFMSFVTFIFLKKFWRLSYSDIISMIMLWTGVFCSFTIISDFLGLTSFYSLYKLEWGVRQVGILGEFNHGASYLGILLPLSIYQISKFRVQLNPFKRTFYFLCCLMIIIAIVLTGSRMGLLLIVVSLFFAAIIDKRYFFRPQVILYIVIGFIFLVVITRYDLVIVFTEFFTEHIRNIYHVLFLGGKEVGVYSLTYRLELLRGAWQMFLDHPWSGVGLGNSYFKMPAYTFINRNWWVHNTYLEILAEVGIFGFTFFMLLMVQLGKNLYYLWQKSRNKVNFYMFVAFLNLCISIFFLSHFNNRYLWMMFIPLSMYIESTRDDISKQNKLLPIPAK
jgi:O-antigen ligase